jgi:hypothetical protein
LAAFERVLSRTPTRDELVECVSFLQHRERSAPTSAATALAAPADSEGKSPAASPALRARENLVHVLMNHHDFVMIR